MKWIYIIQQKAQVAFLLAIILLGVLAKNMMEQENVSELGDSFSSVYEDRLLVESYIYKLSDHLYQKKLIIDQCQTDNKLELRVKMEEHNAAIQSLIRDYEKTKLTNQESVFFLAFKKNMEEMNLLEAQYMELNSVQPSLDKQFDIASGTLHELSSIQISEGKTMADHSRKIVAGSSILSQFELALVVVIGLIIQALIFASRSLAPVLPQKPNLN